MSSKKNALSEAHHLSENEQGFLEHKKKQLDYLKGENIFKQGAFAQYVIYVQTGLVKVYMQTQHNKQINVSLAKSGDFLGFGSVFGEVLYTYSAVSIKDSTICMIDKDGLKELFKTNNEFAMQITSKNFRSEKQHLDLIASLSYKQMRGKLASALMYLASDEFMDEHVFRYLMRHDIAEFAAISNESGIKYLKEFEKEGIIKLENKDVLILDAKKLKTISMMG